MGDQAGKPDQVVQVTMTADQADELRLWLLEGWQLNQLGQAAKALLVALTDLTAAAALDQAAPMT